MATGMKHEAGIMRISKSTLQIKLTEIRITSTIAHPACNDWQVDKKTASLKKQGCRCTFSGKPIRDLFGHRNYAHR